ncbi:MAG: NUDIX domain-containing protein [Phycisphaeraceae bacterium]|nr:NUDIX domain-containing protein [Phycisphaeraceae bacterium]MCW5761715.1 NUDIX domain-containing protein [Phycisphaeraceae bacterium]
MWKWSRRIYRLGGRIGASLGNNKPNTLSSLIVPDPANILPQLTNPGPLPYRLACLCDLRDEQGRVLLIRRKKEPNFGLCSPIGGKLDMETGESPAQCAQREIREEAGIDIPIDRIHLAGLISECAFEGQGHWLLFYYRILGPVAVKEGPMKEGLLEWHEQDTVSSLPLPETDRRIIWPLVKKHENSGHDGKPGFFALHIDCRPGELIWSIEQESP